MIRQEHARHNTAAAVCLLALCTLLVTGCRQEQEIDHVAPVKTVSMDEKCGVIIDTSGWAAFHQLATRLGSGETVSRPELDAYSELKSVKLWRESMDNVPPALRVSNWLENAFVPESGSDKPRKRNSDRRAFTRSFTYSYDQTDLVNEGVAVFLTEELRCRVRKNIDYWLEPDKVPNPLVISFLPGKPELRINDNYLFVDTGVLVASRTTQLERQLTALLYRNLQALPGLNPLAVEGRDAVAHALRAMLNEGIAAYLEDLPDTYFSKNHPTLGRISIVPEGMFEIAVRVMGNLDTALDEMFGDPVLMAERGNELARSLAASGAYQRCGYAMAITIAGHLGEERLHDVRLSPAAFLGAFQEAASLNPSPRPKPGALGVGLHEIMAPLSPAVHDSLHALLTEYFPAP